MVSLKNQNYSLLSTLSFIPNGFLSNWPYDPPPPGELYPILGSSFQRLSPAAPDPASLARRERVVEIRKIDSFFLHRWCRTFESSTFRRLSSFFFDSYAVRCRLLLSSLPEWSNWIWTTVTSKWNTSAKYVTPIKTGESPFPIGDASLSC